VRAAEVQAVVARMKGRANQHLWFFPCELKVEPPVHFRAAQLRDALVRPPKVLPVPLTGVLIPFGASFPRVPGGAAQRSNCSIGRRVKIRPQ